MNLEQLQKEIGAWHIATYGAAPLNRKLGNKLLEEAAEFSVSCGESQDEAADVFISLLAWAERNNVDLIGRANLKLQIVKARNQKQRDEERMFSK